VLIVKASGQRALDQKVQPMARVITEEKGEKGRTNCPFILLLFICDVFLIAFVHLC
jgi:hypothetical protein